MKNLLKVLICSAILFSFNNGIQAQKFVGAGAVYGTEIENLGISIHGKYQFDDEWSAAPSFTYFFKKNNTNLSAIDLDANYQFAELDFAYVYGLAGLSISFYSWDHGFGEYNESYMGLNLGAGLLMPISDNLNFCPEVRYTFGDGDYLRIGVKFLVEI